jgi:hypothetical protein
MKHTCKDCEIKFEEYTHDYTCGVCCGDGDNDGEPCFQCGGDGELSTKHTDICKDCLRQWYQENDD